MLSSLALINQQNSVALERLARYLARVRDDFERGDRYQAMADLAELGEIARRLWHSLQVSKT